jgi:integrase
LAEGGGETGQTFSPDGMTVGAYLDSWLNDSVRGHVRPHIKPALGRLKLSALNPAHVQALYRAKLDEGLSPTTVHRVHEVLHTALKRAVTWDLAPKNVCEAVSVPRRRRPDIRPLNPRQARAFLKAVSGDRYEAFFVLALTAGLRLGELRGLCWDAVDLEGGRLQVKQTLVQAGNGLVFGEPKTARAVPLYCPRLLPRPRPAAAGRCQRRGTERGANQTAPNCRGHPVAAGFQPPAPRPE